MARLLLFVGLLHWTILTVGQSPSDQQGAHAAAIEQQIYNDHRLEEAIRDNELLRKTWASSILPDEAQKNTGIAYTYINAAAAAAQQRQFAAARQWLTQIDSTAFAPQSRVMGRYHLLRAWIDWGTGQYTSALATANRAATLLLAQEDQQGAAFATLMSAFALYYQQNSNYAILEQRIARVYELAQDAFAEDHLIWRYLYQLHGSVLHRQGRVNEAVDRYLEGVRRERLALADGSNGRDSLRLAQYYQQLGHLYAERGSVDQGSSYFDQALHLYRALDEIGEQLKLCVRLAQLQAQKGNGIRVHHYTALLPGLLERYDASPAQQRLSNTPAHLAQAYYYQQTRRPQELLDYYRPRLAMIEREQLSPHRAHQYRAWAYTALGQWEEAKIAYQRAIEQVRRQYSQPQRSAADFYAALAALALQEDDPRQAKNYLDRGIAELAPPATDSFLPELYLAPKRAAQLYRERAQLALLSRDYASAQVDYDRAIALRYYERQHYLGDAAKLLSAQQLRPLYEAAALCAWRQYQIAPSPQRLEQLFGYTERSKGSALQESLLKYRNRYDHQGKQIPTELLQREEGLLVQLGQYKEHRLSAKRAQKGSLVAYYNQKIFEAQEALQALERQLAAEYPHYQAWQKTPSKALPLREVQATLKPDDLLLEYLITDSLCLIWYISQDQAQLVQQPHFNLKRLERQIDLMHRSFSDLYHSERDTTLRGKWMNESHDFYKNYVAHPALEGKKALIVVPDRGLYYIPFEVLLTEAPAPTKSYHQLPYLLRDYAVHYHYSAGLLVYAMQHEVLNSGKLLGFAASYGTQNDYGSLPLVLRQVRSFEEVETHNISPPIPGTLEELEELADRYKGQFFQYDFANERTFKQQFDGNQYGIVHLAMHGLVNYKEPAYSSLVFTENLDSLEDNLLYAYEVQHLQGQQVNLVVLSACKTGFGRYAQGEGIISLGRSFMQAGAPSVVMTLWELNDATTTDLMALFYEGLAKGLTKNEALRQAKLNYLDTHQGISAHPFFWASAICIGNPAPIPIDERHPFWMVVLLLAGLGLAVGLSWRYFLH